MDLLIRRGTVFLIALLLAVAGAPQVSTADTWFGAAAAPIASPQQVADATYTATVSAEMSDAAVESPVLLDSLVSAGNLSGANLIPARQQFTLPPAAPSNTQSPATRGAGAKKIVVSISRQRVQVYQGNTMLWNWPASTGRRSAPTMPGRFTILDKMPSAYGATWGFDMPYWMGIYYAGRVENGFHGLPVSRKTRVKVWQNMVGAPVTFGCIMLSDASMRQLYAWTTVGTLVVINP